jgi:hypothetical protein
MIIQTLFRIFLFSLVLLPIDTVHAHIPLVVEQSSLSDIEHISTPEVSQVFYGAMTGFPHTYEIRSSVPFYLKTEVLIPDIGDTKGIVSGIIIRETGHKGRVEEVARLRASGASWERFYEPFGGDRYLRGANFAESVPAGVYRIEVSTPDNLEKYALSVGNKESFNGISYFEIIGRIADVKVFFGKSRFAVIQSPLVYIPVVLISALALGWYILRQRRRRLTNDILK